MRSAQISAYQTIDTTTADPAQLVLRLLDGAVRFLRQALRGLDRGDVAVFAQGQSRAHAVIAELRSALDHDRGGEIAANLDRLYDFMLRHLTVGLLQKDRTRLEGVATLLVTLREGFDGAAGARRT